MEDVEEDQGGEHGHGVEDVGEPFVVWDVRVEAARVFDETVDYANLMKSLLVVGVTTLIPCQEKGKSTEAGVYSLLSKSGQRTRLVKVSSNWLALCSRRGSSGDEIE